MKHRLKRGVIMALMSSVITLGFNLPVTTYASSKIVPDSDMSYTIDDPIVCSAENNSDASDTGRTCDMDLTNVKTVKFTVYGAASGSGTGWSTVDISLCDATDDSVISSQTVGNTSSFIRGNTYATFNIKTLKKTNDVSNCYFKLTAFGRCNGFVQLECKTLEITALIKPIRFVSSPAMIMFEQNPTSSVSKNTAGGGGTYHGSTVNTKTSYYYDWTNVDHVAITASAGLGKCETGGGGSWTCKVWFEDDDGNKFCETNLTSNYDIPVGELVAGGETRFACANLHAYVSSTCWVKDMSDKPGRSYGAAYANIGQTVTVYANCGPSFSAAGSFSVLNR